MTVFIYNICVLIINLILSVVIPLIVTFVLTILVIHEFRRINRTLNGSVSTGSDSRQGERNLTRSMIAVNVAFIILTLPPTVLRVFLYFFNLETNIYYIVVLNWLIITSDTNFSINMCIYSLYVPVFRATFGGSVHANVAGRRKNQSLAMSVL